MAGQGYKRTNFEDDDSTVNGGTTGPDLTYNPPPVNFRGRGVGLWKSRTLFEKILLILLAVLLFTLVVMAIVMAVKNSQLDTLREEKSTYCLSHDCVNVASTLMLNMDMTADPCEDFYQYACGGWMKKNPIPSGRSRWGTFEVLNQRNMLVIKNALDKPDSAFKSKAELKAKKFYKSCMDDDNVIETVGAKPLLDLVNSFGWGINFTALGPAFTLPEDWKFDKMLEDCHMTGISTFFSFGVGEDAKNSSANILEVDQAGLSLISRDQYLNKSISEDKILKAFHKYTVKIFTLLGAPNETHTTDMMAKMIEFETRLANITTPDEDRRDDKKLYNKYTISNMTKSFPQVQWFHFIKHIMNIGNISVGPNEPVIVAAPEYLNLLETILTEYRATDEGRIVLTHYFLWHVVKPFVTLLSKPFREASKEYSEVVTGRKGNDELWHDCIENTDGTLGFATGALFVKEAFKGESLKKAKKMVSDVIGSFKLNLPNLSWMDPKTQAAAIDKANAVTDMIGYPEYILDPVKLDEKYEGLNFTEKDYFGNNIASLRFAINKSLKELRRVPRNEWAMSPPTVNAYYTVSKNTIVFPAGILQAPFFDDINPESLNYGAMGVVMGHELTHGFDDQGREYDKHGNLKEWWDPAAVKRFTKKTQCMIDQYSGYTIYGEHERGKQNLGENIADNGGLKSAYNAYIDWVSRNAPEQPLPGIGLNHKQLFFLSFAQVWCWNSRPEAVHLQVIKDPHAPAKSRVIGPLSNSKDFAEVYKCSATSKMNPKKKCEVW